MIDLDMPLLSGGRLAVCIAQIEPVSVEVVAADGTRPATVTALRDLIAGRADRAPSIDMAIPGLLPALVLAPEYALGSPDWANVDTFVRSSSRPLVLIAGFGMTAGAWIVNWANGIEAASPTKRVLGWDQETSPITPDRATNGGWCWLHRPGTEPVCVAFVKNFLEQAHEAAQFPRLQYGTTIVRLRFVDLDLFPLVCADLVRPRHLDSSTAQARITSALDHQGGARTILVAGCLFEKQPHNLNWQTAISDIVNHLAPTKQVILALANQACGSPSDDEERDKWRSLSGLYSRHTDFAHGQRALPAGRPIVMAGISGVIIRDSGPCMVAGPVAWGPYTPVASQYIWHTEVCSALGRDGIQPAFAPHAFIPAYELHRFTCRHPALAGWSPRVAGGLVRIRQHLETGLPPRAEGLLRSLLTGVTNDPPPPDPDHLHTATLFLKEAIYSLAVLSTLDEMTWQNDTAQDGQLTWNAANMHLLVWRDQTRTGRRMIRDLELWIQQPSPHPRLLVIGQGATPLTEGIVGGDRRTDISEPPAGSDDLSSHGDAASSDRDISLPKAPREAACIHLARVADYYIDFDEADEAVQVAGLVHSLRESFSGVPA